MKITRIRPWHVSGPPADATEVSPKLSYVFVQVETDGGLTGWGEVTTYPGPVANRTIVAALCEVDEFLRGDDPTQIEAIWHKLLRAFTYVGTRGATTAMVSGIDIALWDIKGQALGVPIYELLGGAVRETIPLYTHSQYSPTVAEMVKKALSWPARQIAINAGEDGSVVVGKIQDNDTYAFGFDAQTGKFENLVSHGIIDPTKVVRTALQDAASIAGLLITTEAMVAEKPKKETPMPAMPPGGGMDY